MRVVRTEMYFDKMLVKWTVKSPDSYPSVSAAWVRFDDGHNISDSDLAGLLDDKFPRLYKATAFTPEFIDIAIQNATREDTEYQLSKQHWDVNNPEIVKAVLSSEVVYESSPPKSIPLHDILKMASSGVIGLPIGAELAGAMGHRPLMIVTVPLAAFVVGTAMNITKGVGILLIGGAEAVTQGLRSSLPKKIERLVNGSDSSKSKS